MAIKNYRLSMEFSPANSNKEQINILEKQVNTH
ncbi:Uncharacterised protein [Elizabethkingia anophelis]|uniref:Uncharacterized protein n=1 Tax=Elizabethkingia anophelis TaxID=1117645 RepID=A0A7Z7LUD9_9FLAO|nr:Uncharacterised protein [Elizabethkingia anophelis]